MLTPQILQIDPPQLDDVEAGFHGTTIRLFGTRFSPGAEAVVLGSGTIYDTTWLSNEMLECKLDVYGHEAFVIGVIVLNDTENFSPGSSSNVVPLRIPKTIPPQERHDDTIPF
jgi:hypothetical protein